jgi:hypothetical protein
MGRSLRLVVSAVTLAALLAACGASTRSTLPASNVATGFIDAVRANDAPGACFMTTANARRDLARLLRQSGASAATNVCAQPTIASRKVRAAAMRPFVGNNANSGGITESGSKAIEWSRSADGRYAVVVVSRHGADGLLVDSIRLEASCSACR